MSDFQFTPTALAPKRITSAALVAVSVRPSAKNWVTIRFQPELLKRTAWRAETKLSLFVDEKRRAVLLLSDQRPLPPGSRPLKFFRCRQYVEFPRSGVFAEWFAPGPIRDMQLVEAQPGRLLFQVPEKA